MDNVYEQENTLDLQELAFILLKNCWIIFIVTIIFAVSVALFTSYGIENKYQSHAIVTVISEDQETNQSSDSLRVTTEMAERFSIIAKTNTVLEAVSNDLNLTHGILMKPAQLAGAFTISPQNDTDILKVTVTYKDPVIAQYIAERITERTKNVYEATYEKDNVKWLDHAVFNENPISPNLMLNTLIGVVLGGVVSIVIILIKEMLNRKVRTVKDLEVLDIPFLGSIQDLTKYTKKKD